MTPRELVESYIRAVQDGSRVAGKLERQAVERHLRDLADGHTRGLKFDELKATRSIEFIHRLELTEGEYAGQPMRLAPWQAFIVWNLFGWTKHETGFRRFKRAFVSVGRGNGKTPFASAIALLVTGFDTPLEAEAQGYFTATKRDQAKLAFKQACSFIDNSTRGLKQYAVTYRDLVKFPANRAELKVISSDGKSSDGFNPALVIKDEYHAWTEQHKDFNAKLETALSKRRQPLQLTITTAGDDTSDLWLEEHRWCRLVLDGSVESDDLFCFICEIDGEPGDDPDKIDDPLDEKCWPKANPMLEFGVVKIDGLRELAARAKTNQQKYDDLKRYHCNKLATSASRLFRAEQWGLGNKPLPWDKIDKGDCFAFAALDWGWKDDLSALGWVFDLDMHEQDGEWRRWYGLHVDVWIPEGGQRNLDKSPWREWIKGGWIMPTSGKTTDTNAVHKTFAERWDTWNIRGVAYDGNNAREFGSTIDRAYGIESYAFPQTYAKYNEPTRELAVALAEGRVIHGGNPVLAWAAGNAIAKKDNNELMMPDKRRSADKIDPIVAVIMAFSEAQFHERTRPSFYESHGLEAG